MSEELIRREYSEWEAIKANWGNLKDLALKGASSPLTRRNYAAGLDDWARFYDTDAPCDHLGLAVKIRPAA